MTWQQVKAIRQLHSWRTKGRTHADIAAMFGVSTTTIFKAVNRIAPYDKKRPAFKR